MEKEARKTMRVAVYCRLARADQDDTLLETQKERLRVYAKERGYGDFSLCNLFAIYSSSVYGFRTA